MSCGCNSTVGGIVINGGLIEILDEGISQGFVNAIDFVGAGVTAVVVGQQATVTIPGGGGAPVSVEVTADGSVTNNTAGYVVAAGMSLALGIGTWVVIFSTEQRQNVAGGTTSIALFNAGVIIANTERQQLQLAEAGEWHNGETQKRIVLAAPATIDARFKTSVLGTQAELRRRSLIAIQTT